MLNCLRRNPRTRTAATRLQILLLRCTCCCDHPKGWGHASRPHLNSQIQSTNDHNIPKNETRAVCFTNYTYPLRMKVLKGLHQLASSFNWAESLTVMVSILDFQDFPGRVNGVDSKSHFLSTAATHHQLVNFSCRVDHACSPVTSVSRVVLGGGEGSQRAVQQDLRTIVRHQLFARYNCSL